MLAKEELPLINDIAPEVPRAVVPVGIRWANFGADVGHQFRDRHLDGYRGPIIMFLGRLTEKKGIDILIEAFAKVAESGAPARLVIAGGDNEGVGDSLKDLARKKGVAERTVFTGPLRGEEKLAALASADIWVLSSRSEGFPTAVLEALAAGCACLLSPAVFIGREVDSAGAGIQCELTSAAFADAMLILLAEPERRRRLGAAARAFAKRYDWDVVSREWEAMYREAAPNSSRPGRAGIT
jgi:glycosyltransferase involved in cell wall biosynthesis